MALSANEIQQTLIKTIKTATERSVQQAEYDKTVLATVQFCTDIGMGQYKIKYQNGYFTAYAQDTSVKYSNGAIVYVTIPKNNLNNRLIITGLATNDSNAKTYMTNYETDQQYGTDGTELIYGRTNPLVIQMSTYDSMGDAEPYTKPLIYDRNNESNSLVDLSRGLDGKGDPKGLATVEELIKTGGGYLRLSAKFRTDIPEAQRFSGNYGLVIKLRFFATKNDIDKKSKGKKYNTVYKEYVLDAMSMSGTPYDYFIATEQHAFFQIDKELFEQVECIYPFVRSFNEVEEIIPHPANIFITDLSLQNAYLLYDTNNNKYKGELICDDGFTFEATTNTSEVRKKKFTARLRVDGNIIENPKEQKVEFYWAIEDAAVGEKNPKRYNKYTGIGWRCINTVQVKEYDSTQESVPLDSQAYIIDDDSDLTHVKYHTWKCDSDTITIKETSFPGKTNKLKCVIVYNNVPISVIKEVTNENGIYLIFNSSNGLEFNGGAGVTTLAVGAFKDVLKKSPQPGEYPYTLTNVTLDSNSITKYKWTITDVAGTTKEIPPVNPQEYIFESAEGWVSKHEHNDDETISSDTAVNAWLAKQPDSWARCLERYNYYSAKYYAYKDKASTQDDDYRTYAATALRRMKAIETNVKTLITTMYAEGVENSGAYIFGPSSITASYGSEATNKTTNITNVTPYYYGTSSYNTYKDFQNTLAYLLGSMVGYRSTIRVSAIKGSREVASQSITLVSSESSNLDYTIEMVNGTQSFMYNNGGVSPASKKVPSPIAIQPLYYKLYDKEGTLIYNSQEPDSTENKTDMTTLAPKWIFRTASDSLIQTKYDVGSTECVANPKDPNEIWRSMLDEFHYTIAEKFNRSLIDTSNIILELHYDDQVIRGTTNFTFAKQGDLGTNGTDSYLDIEDPVYEKFKNDILTGCTGSVIRERVNGVLTKKRYSPEERHLKNTYLFANKSYNSSGGAGSLGDPYVNLKFAKRHYDPVNPGANVINNKDYIEIKNDVSFTNLYGIWTDKGVQKDIDPSSVWSTIQGKGWRYTSTTSEQREQVSGKPPFKLDVPAVDPGASTYSKVTIIEENNKPYSYRPSPIDDYPIDGSYGYHASTNTVALEASPKSGTTDDPWHGYAYYPMPYFYYSSTRTDDWIQYINPATRIVVVGGFDQVIYDSAGRNPDYDKQNPFKVFIFDEEGNDITTSVMSNGTVTWECSSSLKKMNKGTIEFLSYNTIDSNVNLNDKYIAYPSSSDANKKYYHCIYPHTKASLEKNVNFQESYWEQVTPVLERKQKFKVTPPSRYEYTVQQDMFSSWVRVSVRYNFPDNNAHVIEAEAYIPINMICNKYGSDDINNWDGKKSKVEDGYIISSKVAAGKKYDDNTFTGITIGESFYTETSSRKNEVGLFAYGRTDKNHKDPNSWARTAFLDAQSGRVILGASGGSQIVLDPRPQTGSSQIWSKLNGWYISSDFFYKPIGEATKNINTKEARNELFTDLSQGAEIKPPKVADLGPNGEGTGSIGMYCPFGKKVKSTDVFLWASSKHKDLGDEIIEQDLAKYKRQVRAYGVSFNGYVMDKDSEEQVRKTKFDRINDDTLRIQLIDDWIEAIEEAPPGESPPIPILPPGDPNRDIYETFDIPTLTKKRSDTQADLTDAQIDYNNFTKAVDNYESTYSRYQQLMADESSGALIGYGNFNNKKANFYVTYGGHLHASSADIEGHLVATSGRFGNGSNKVEIAIERENKKYILYNKNFYIQDTQGESNDNVEVFMKGKIMAKAGQFGSLTSDTNGDSPNTLFINYTWYPWHLPEETQKWDNTTYYRIDQQGLSESYALYNKNFFIKNNGTVFFNGELYTKKGRIGDWVIKDSEIKSVREAGQTNFISMTPKQFQFGTVYINPDGSLGKSDHSWWIKPDGSASFEKVEKMVITGPSGSTGGVGLKLANGQAIEFGDNSMRMVANTNGFTFEGKATFNDNITLTSGKSFSCTGVGGGITISNGEINFGSEGGSGGKIDSSGNANFKSFKVGGNLVIDSSGAFNMDNVTFNGDSLEDYIKSVVKSMTIVASSISTPEPGVYHSHGIVVS